LLNSYDMCFQPFCKLVGKTTLIEVMETICKGWFSDVNERMWPGQAISLQVDEVLFHEKSDYQDVMVMKTYVEVPTTCF